MPYDPEIHHRRSIRLRHYDYRRPGSYYVTICVHEKRCVFGEIADAVAHLNELGNIAQTNWLAMPQRFPTIEVDEYIIMPNHMHGIITITETSSSMKAPALGQIIRAFKSATTTQIHATCMPEFEWQNNYYERIIRKDGEINRVRQYIINNPLRWSLQHQP
ncbi:MAG: transposase [Ktedonobacteraceae bacterium]